MWPLCYRGTYLQWDPEWDGNCGSDTGSNLFYSGRSFRVLRGPSLSSSQWTAPTDPAAIQLNHMSYFPPASSVLTLVYFSFINCASVVFLEGKKNNNPASWASCIFIYWVGFTIPHRPGNKVNHIPKRGLSQLRFAETQTSGVVLRGPQINIKVTVWWGIWKHFYMLGRLSL